jgi:hypothetical protein
MNDELFNEEHRLTMQIDAILRAHRQELEPLMARLTHLRSLSVSQNWILKLEGIEKEPLKFFEQYK